MARTSTVHEIRQTWESVAASALLQVDLRAGRSFLDVAAGSGALSLIAARTGATVTAVDGSASMIGFLEERARLVGLEVDTHVMDSTGLRFSNDSFDVVSSLNGVSILPDATAGLAEMIRVTRPTGQVQVVDLGVIDGTALRAFLESAQLSEVRVVSKQVEIPVTRDDVVTIALNIGTGTKP